MNSPKRFIILLSLAAGYESSVNYPFQSPMFLNIIQKNKLLLSVHMYTINDFSMK